MEKLKQIFASVLGIPEEKVVDTLSPKNTPSWDSLNAIILLTEIEDAFKVKFGYDEAMAIQNFGDAVKLIRGKKVKL